MAQNGALSTNQRRALAALLSTPTVGEAARQAKLGRRTIHRYLSDATFKAELRRRQAEVVTATVSALSGLSGDAVKTLHQVMGDPAATHSDRRQASVSWLEMVLKVHGVFDDGIRIEMPVFDVELWKRQADKRLAEVEDMYDPYEDPDLGDANLQTDVGGLGGDQDGGPA